MLDYILISIDNSIVSSAIWEKHAQVGLSKTNHLFFPNSREIIILLDNNIYRNE